ncbi:hypothetical protein Emag_002510 [Eimeria magna]
MHVAPVDVGWRGDAAVSYPDPDEVLDPCAAAASAAFPLYSVDSGLSSESSVVGWACDLPPCVPPLGLVAVSLGLQLASGLLLYAVAANGQRLHGIEPSLTDPELPFIHSSFTERSPKTYAWCVAYVLAALLVGPSLVAAGAAAAAIFLACPRQSGLGGSAVATFLKPFNYGTLLFVLKQEHMIRAAGTMAAAAAAAAARLIKATCHDTAAAATLSGYGLVVAWAVCFLLMQGAIGGMAPPIFGVPALCACLLLLASLNLDCCSGSHRDVVCMLLFFLSCLVACVAWASAYEMYTMNYSDRNHKATFLTQQLQRLVNLEQWGRALGGGLGVAALICLAATQALLCLFVSMIFFYRVFGDKIEAIKRKRKEKKLEKNLCCVEASSPPIPCPPSPHVEPYEGGAPDFLSPLASLPLAPPPLPPSPPATHPELYHCQQQQEQQKQQQQQHQEQQQQQQQQQEQQQHQHQESSNISSSSNSSNNSSNNKTSSSSSSSSKAACGSIPLEVYRQLHGGGRRKASALQRPEGSLEEPKVTDNSSNINTTTPAAAAAAAAAAALTGAGVGAAMACMHACMHAGSGYPDALKEGKALNVAPTSFSGLLFPSSRYQRPLSIFKEPQPQAEGLASFWWTEQKHLEEQQRLHEETEEPAPTSPPLPQQPQQPQQHQQQDEQPQQQQQQKPQDGQQDGEGLGLYVGQKEEPLEEAPKTLGGVETSSEEKGSLETAQETAPGRGDRKTRGYRYQ